jgi:hypothetical protein
MPPEPHLEQDEPQAAMNLADELRRPTLKNHTDKPRPKTYSTIAGPSS